MQLMRKILTLITLSFIMMGCEKTFTKQPDDSPEAIFDNLWTTFSEEYAPFAERNINWQAEYEAFRPMVNSNTTDTELFSVLSQLLATLDDGHVTLTAPDQDLFYSNKIKRERIDDGLFSIQVIKSYLEAGFEEGSENSYIYGKINNQNVAYIYFDYVAENFFKLNDFLDKYYSVNGYIIDLRHNQGGDFTYSFSEIGRLTDQKHFVFRSKTKNGTGANDYTDWYDWNIHPEGDYIDKPIIILTDRYTISAGERSVMAFKTLPNVLVMGDTTNGAHGTMIGRELANGWFYSLVPQKVEMSDGESYEGIGLSPDIYIKNTLTDIAAGIDETLQSAIDILK
jgi:carboxyl-terminal processing protease